MKSHAAFGLLGSGLFCIAAACNNSGGGGHGAGGSAGAGEGGAAVGGSGGGVGQGGTGGSGAGGSGGGAGGMSGAGGAVATVDYFIYVTGGDKIDTFKLDIDTGAVSAGPAATAAGSGIFNATYLSFRPNGLALYATDELGPDVGALSIARGTGQLTPLSEMESGGGSAVHSSVHPSGKWLFVSNYGGGNVRVFPIKDNGDLGAPSDTQVTGAESHQVVSSPNGKFVFAPCRGPNNIVQFTFDENTGKLTANVPRTVASDDPRHIAFHPNGKYAYVVNEKPDGGGAAPILVFAVDANGRLSELQRATMAPTEKWGAHVVVTPDGKYVYASGRDTNSVYGYSVGSADGKLTTVGTWDGTGVVSSPRDFAVDPKGHFLVVASENNPKIVVLKINPADGTLSKVGDPTPTPSGGSSVVVVPVPRP